MYVYATLAHYDIFVSSVAYNPYIKPQLATSDYDGTLSIWDTNQVKCVHTYQVSKLIAIEIYID